MSALKIDVGLVVPPHAAAQRARELAATGIDGLFTFENAHDVFLPLAMATTTTDVDLMTNVAIAFPRSPVHLAHAAYDLQVLSHGRFRLGLGSQIKPQIERRYGATWSRPAARMREMVLAIKAVFACWEGKAPLDFRGEFTTHTLMTPYFDPGPNPYGPPPVLVGALGPRMTEIAAEVADGLLVMPFNSARHLSERTMPAIERGLCAGGRAQADLEIVAEVIVATGRTEQELADAAAGTKTLLAFYGSTPSYRPVLEVEGWADLQPELNAMSKRGEWQEMTNLVDDRMLETIAVFGTPEECAGQIVERFGSFADRVCCYFPYGSITDERVAELVSAVRAAA